MSRMFAYICVNMKLNTCNMSLIADYVDMNLKPQQKLNAEYKNIPLKHDNRTPPFPVTYKVLSFKI